jgi:hypothetical protein
MKLLLVSVTAAIVLWGCASSEQLAANEDAKCQAYGFSPGAYGYPECRMNLDMLRQQAQKHTW